MDERTPSWGITPVPERLRVLGLFDLTLLWGNLSVSLLVIVAAAGLVPMLSLPQALLALAIGALAGNVLLGLAGAIGADARVPGMVLLRAPSAASASAIAGSWRRCSARSRSRLGCWARSASSAAT